MMNGPNPEPTMCGEQVAIDLAERSHAEIARLQVSNQIHLSAEPQAHEDRSGDRKACVIRQAEHENADEWQAEERYRDIWPMHSVEQSSCKETATYQRKSCCADCAGRDGRRH